MRFKEKKFRPGRYRKIPEIKFTKPKVGTLVKVLGYDIVGTIISFDDGNDDRMSTVCILTPRGPLHFRLGIIRSIE